MPLNDVDVYRRRFSIALPTDLVDFIVHSYDEETSDVEHVESFKKMVDLIEKQMTGEKVYWIEVINRSSVELPEKIQAFCEYLDIHPLTIEDISTLAPFTKLDFFQEQGALYLLMKIVSWSGERVEQQQISFYLKSSRNLLITFQEKLTGSEALFDNVRDRLQRERTGRSESFSSHLHHRIRQTNVDYLFYCLFDAIIDRAMVVLEEIARQIDSYDEILMEEKRASTLASLHSIYRLRHDLLHLRILYSPLKEIIHRLQRIKDGDFFTSVPRTKRLRRLDVKHHLIRRKESRARLGVTTTTSSTIKMRQATLDPSRRTSIFLTDCIYIYLSDLNDHVDHLIDYLEIQRESVSLLVSFWKALNVNQTEQVLKLLMLITVPFFPCLVLTGINSMNYHNEPPLHYRNGYFITLALIGTILFGMLTLYKFKRWI